MRSKSLAVAILFCFAQSANALSIDEYISQAKQKNPLLKSYHESEESADLQKTAANIDLSPSLTAGYLKSIDESQPSQLGTTRRMEVYNLGVAEKFSTGTSVSLSAQEGQFTNDNVPFPGFDLYSTGQVALKVQQSLWKDFFGYGTRLKISRLEKLADEQKLSVDLQSRSALYDVESNFWDYAVAMEDLKLKQSNLERAQKIDKWTSNRVANGISDRADLMDAKALVASREAQLVAAAEELKTQEIKFRDNMLLDTAEATPPVNSADLNVARPYFLDLKRSKKVEQIEARLAEVDAEAKKMIANETVDNLRPDLSVFGEYATTSYNRDHQQAINDITRTDFPIKQVGVNLTWVFDTDAKVSLRQSADKEALAAKLKADKKRIDGVDSWNEVLRKYDVLKKTVDSLQQAATYQRERAKAEQDKLAKGRTTTMNVVLAETDAAEAELTLLRTKSSLRKLEASSLFFVVVQE